MNLNIIDICYVTPEQIIPDYTISAQNIFKGFKQLYSPYQVLGAEIKEKLIKLLPGEKILVAITDNPVKIPDTDQISLIEKMVSKFIEKLGIGGYFHKMKELDWKIIKTFGGQTGYKGSNVKSIDKIEGFNSGDVSLAQNSFTAPEIETIIKADRTYVEPVIFGNYNISALAEVVEDLKDREFREHLKPNSIGSQLFLLIDHSYSMEHFNRLDAAKYAANIFYKHLKRFYPVDSIRIYQFAFFAERVSPEKIDKIKLAECTNMALALERVISDLDFRIIAPKHIYIFTDGLPHDYYETLEVCKQIKEKEVDLDLIIFKASNEEIMRDIGQYPHLFKMGTQDIQEMYLKNFSNIAKEAGGNITLVKELPLLATTQILIHEYYKVYICDIIMQKLFNGISNN